MTFFTWLNQWWRRSTGTSFPRIPSGERFRPYDFSASLNEIYSRRNDFRDSGNWGHLIFDEAQDYPKEAHTLLSLVPLVVFSDLDDTEKPSMTILADENQRLNESNSTFRGDQNSS